MIAANPASPPWSSDHRIRAALVFLLPLFGIAALPLVPEVILWAGEASDVKNALPIIYYQSIVSFLLVIPALLLPTRGARWWIAVIVAVLTPVTLIATFYAMNMGVRWDLTAHGALMQTNSSEAWSYIATFASGGRVVAVGLLLVAFAAFTYLALRAAPPAPRVRVAVVILGLVLSAYGLRNTLVYGRHIVREVSVADGQTVRLAGIGINLLHPLTLFAATHYNYRTSHAYYLRQFQHTPSPPPEFAGAKPIPGATVPRIVVVVIGESATRRHWSLYGYPRPTTPRLQQLGPELFVFDDVVSVSVGTLVSIRAMLTAEPDATPIFPLFSGAGYETHWLSAQHHLGFDDLELGALGSACDHSTFLNGAYDERLLPLLAAAVARPGPQLIFLNFMGSHIRYRDRFPSKYTVFSAASDLDELRADYDNSIRYTDHVLGEMIAQLRSLHEPACLLYVSDHGEDVLDSRPDKYLFRSEALATDPMYEVPFVVWLSPEYQRANVEFSRSLASSVHHKFQNRNLYQSLLSLSRLSHPKYDPHADLFSPRFSESERRIGIARRLYVKPPPVRLDSAPSPSLP